MKFAHIGSRLTALWSHRNLFWQPSRDESSFGPGMSQPVQNHPSGHCERWAAEEMLDGQREGVDISAHTRTAHNGLPQNRLQGYLCWIVPHSSYHPHPPTTQLVEGLSWTNWKTEPILAFCVTESEDFYIRRFPEASSNRPVNAVQLPSVGRTLCTLSVQPAPSALLWTKLKAKEMEKVKEELNVLKHDKWPQGTARCSKIVSHPVPATITSNTSCVRKPCDNDNKNNGHLARLT